MPFDGYSVTIPHKTPAMEVMDEVEITLEGGRTFKSRCDDDPNTEVDESELSLEGFACPVP